MALSSIIPAPYSFLVSMASATNTLLTHKISIFRGIRMSFRTVSFAVVHCCDSNTSQNILATSYDFKMSRVHAKTITTEIVNRHSGGDVINQQFIGKSVGKDISLATNKPKLSVSLTNNTPLPIPTIRFPLLIHFRPKPFSSGYGQEFSSNFVFHNDKYSTRDYPMSTGGI